MLENFLIQNGILTSRGASNDHNDDNLNFQIIHELFEPFQIQNLSTIFKYIQFQLGICSSNNNNNKLINEKLFNKPEQLTWNELKISNTATKLNMQNWSKVVRLMSLKSNSNNEYLLFKLPTDVSVCILYLIVRILSCEGAQEFEEHQARLFNLNGTQYTTTTTTPNNNNNKLSFLWAKHSIHNLEHESYWSNEIVSEKSAAVRFIDQHLQHATMPSKQQQHPLMRQTSTDEFYKINTFKWAFSYDARRAKGSYQEEEDEEEEDFVGGNMTPNQLLSNLIKSLEVLVRETGVQRALLPPLSRLLGLLASTSITTENVSNLLSLVVDSQSVYNRIFVLSILQEAAVKHSGYVAKSKAFPRPFFNISPPNIDDGPKMGGLVGAHSINSREEQDQLNKGFAVAFWFRVEDYPITVVKRPLLFQMVQSTGMNENRGSQRSDVVGLRVLLDVVPQYGSDNNCVAHIVIHVLHGCSPRQEFKMNCCVLSSKVWYHLGIKVCEEGVGTFGTNLIKNMFTSRKENNKPTHELALFLDGRSLLREKVRFPSFTESTYRSLQIHCGAYFDGQFGSIHVTSDTVENRFFSELMIRTDGLDLSGEDKYVPDYMWDGEGILHGNDDALAAASQNGSLRVKSENFIRNIDADSKRRSWIGRSRSYSTTDAKENVPQRCLLMWDPAKYNRMDRLVVDVHSGTHAKIPFKLVKICSSENIQNIVHSLGGVQILLPLFRIQSLNEKSDGKCLNNELPLLFLLLASFCVHNQHNSDELLRCGSIEIIEQSIRNFMSGAISLMSLDHRLASNCIEALVLLKREVSLTNTRLEAKIISRLLFNLSLWLPSHDKGGISMYIVLAVQLSSIAKAEPNKIRDCISVADLVCFVDSILIVPKWKLGGKKLFNRDHGVDSGSPNEGLSVEEARHIFDIIFGIIVTLLATKVTTKQLHPLLNFIAHNANGDFSSKSIEDGQVSIEGERYLVQKRALSVLMFLLDSPVPIPGLLESLIEVVSDSNSVAAWLLCCIVNSADDYILGIGVRCFTSYVELVKRRVEANPNETNIVVGAKSDVIIRKPSLKVLGKQISNSEKLNMKISYKLLWHILKAHRYDMDELAYASLIFLVLDDCDKDLDDSMDVSFLRDTIVAMDQLLDGAFIFNNDLIRSQMCEISVDSSQIIRNKWIIGTALRLLRFFPDKLKERFLFDLVTITQINPINCEKILLTSQWQACLFQFTSDVVEEVGKKQRAVDIRGSDCPAVLSRFDLVSKLYSTLLARSIRSGDDAIDTLVYAASLEKTCVNGEEVFGILLSHIIKNLSENVIELSDGCIKKQEIPTSAPSQELGTENWRRVRVIIHMTLAVVTKSGLGINKIFDLKRDASIDLDGTDVLGVDLSDELIRPVSPEDSTKSKLVTLAAQALTFVDSFIFPTAFIELPNAQIIGLALAKLFEPFFGEAQGPLLASLVRLSLLLLVYLDPSSLKYRENCARLQSLFQWVLEVIRESVITTGYNTAFQEHTIVLDRLVIAVVLYGHKALDIIRRQVDIIEMNDDLFSTTKEKNTRRRRLLQSAFDLKQILTIAVRRRSEALREALTLEAYEFLQASVVGTKRIARRVSIGEVPWQVKEQQIQAFLSSDWVKNFHDFSIGEEHNILIPSQLSNGQIYQNRTASNRGRIVIEELVNESKLIVKQYEDALRESFEDYCEEQRQWADTEPVRDLEFAGDSSQRRLVNGYKNMKTDSNRQSLSRSEIAKSLWDRVESVVSASWSPWGFDDSSHWMFPRNIDFSQRRILLLPNPNFDDHQSHSYALSLGSGIIENNKSKDDEEEKLKRLARIAERASVIGQSNECYNDSDDDSDVNYNEEHDEECSSDSVDVSGWNKEKNIEMAQDQQFGDSVEKQKEHNYPTELTEEVNEIDGEWDKIEESEVDEGLSEANNTHWSSVFSWTKGEKPLLSSRVNKISLRDTTKGEILLTNFSIFFRQTENPINVMTKDNTVLNWTKSKKMRRWNLGSLVELQGRRYIMRNNAVEMFFSDNDSLFLSFEGEKKERDNFVSKLKICRTPLFRYPLSLTPKTIFKKSVLTELWQRRVISNFDYIMQLNLIAGRSFNDITQYPIFPWILNDYTSDTLDLNDPRIYRDLSKPIGALNPDRLAMLIERYNEFYGVPDDEKFLYGSMYSSPGIVLHYMVRLEPFTSMAVELQSGRFDVPDRLFFDIAQCWEGCMKSTSDVKELIPQFFTCPEMFENAHDYPLGKLQNGHDIKTVRLPPWAKGSAEEFVRIHRAALESNFVSKHLHQWIDLIFGSKQRGPNALSAYNLFHPLSYEGSVDLEKIEDEIDRIATEAHIQNFGQIPSLLYNKKQHPSRDALEDCWIPLCSSMRLAHLPDLQAFQPKEQYGTTYDSPILDLVIMEDTVYAIHGNLAIVTYSWSPKTHGPLPYDWKKLSVSSYGIQQVSTKPTTKIAAARAALSSSAGKSSKSSYDSQSDLKTRRYMTCNLSFQVAVRESNDNNKHITYLISSGFYDNLIRVHSLDGTNKPSSSSSMPINLKATVENNHRGAVTSFAVGTPDNTFMVTGGTDATCKVWLIDNLALAEALVDEYTSANIKESSSLLHCCHVLWGHETPISAVVINTDLNIIVSGSIAGRVCVHMLKSGTFVRFIDHAEHGEVKFILLDDDGLVVVYFTNGVQISYSINFNKLGESRSPDAIKTAILESGMMIVGNEAGFVEFYELPTFKLHHSIDLSDHGAVTSLHLNKRHYYGSSSSGDNSNMSVNQYLFAGCRDGTIQIIVDSKFRLNRFHRDLKDFPIS